MPDLSSEEILMQMNVRGIDRELVEQAKRVAAENGESLKAFVVRVVTEAVDKAPLPRKVRK